jgi:hypothetical protein
MNIETKFNEIVFKNIEDFFKGIKDEKVTADKDFSYIRDLGLFDSRMMVNLSDKNKIELTEIFNACIRKKDFRAFIEFAERTVPGVSRRYIDGARDSINDIVETNNYPERADQPKQDIESASYYDIMNSFDKGAIAKLTQLSRAFKGQKNESLQEINGKKGTGLTGVEFLALLSGSYYLKDFYDQKRPSFERFKSYKKLFDEKSPKELLKNVGIDYDYVKEFFEDQEVSQDTENSEETKKTLLNKLNVKDEYKYYPVDEIARIDEAQHKMTSMFSRDIVKDLIDENLSKSSSYKKINELNRAGKRDLARIIALDDGEKERESFDRLNSFAQAIKNGATKFYETLKEKSYLAEDTTLEDIEDKLVDKLAEGGAFASANLSEFEQKATFITAQYTQEDEFKKLFVDEAHYTSTNVLGEKEENCSTTVYAKDEGNTYILEEVPLPNGKLYEYVQSLQDTTTVDSEGNKHIVHSKAFVALQEQLKEKFNKSFENLQVDQIVVGNSALANNLNTLRTNTQIADHQAKARKQNPTSAPKNVVQNKINQEKTNPVLDHFKQKDDSLNLCTANFVYEEAYNNALKKLSEMPFADPSWFMGKTAVKSDNEFEVESSKEPSPEEASQNKPVAEKTKEKFPEQPVVENKKEPTPVGQKSEEVSPEQPAVEKKEDVSQEQPVVENKEETPVEKKTEEASQEQDENAKLEQLKYDTIENYKNIVFDFKARLETIKKSIEGSNLSKGIKHSYIGNIDELIKTAGDPNNFFNEIEAQITHAKSKEEVDKACDAFLADMVIYEEETNALVGKFDKAKETYSKLSPKQKEDLEGYRYRLSYIMTFANKIEDENKKSVYINFVNEKVTLINNFLEGKTQDFDETFKGLAVGIETYATKVTQENSKTDEKTQKVQKLLSGIQQVQKQKEKEQAEKKEDEGKTIVKNIKNRQKTQSGSSKGKTIDTSKKVDKKEQPGKKSQNVTIIKLKADLEKGYEDSTQKFEKNLSDFEEKLHKVKSESNQEKILYDDEKNGESSIFNEHHIIRSQYWVIRENFEKKLAEAKTKKQINEVFDDMNKKLTECENGLVEINAKLDAKLEEEKKSTQKEPEVIFDDYSTGEFFNEKYDDVKSEFDVLKAKIKACEDKILEGKDYKKFSKEVTELKESVYETYDEIEKSMQDGGDQKDYEIAYNTAQRALEGFNKELSKYNKKLQIDTKGQNEQQNDQTPTQDKPNATHKTNAGRNSAGKQTISKDQINNGLERMIEILDQAKIDDEASKEPNATVATKEDKQEPTPEVQGEEAKQQRGNSKSKMTKEELRKELNEVLSQYETAMDKYADAESKFGSIYTKAYRMANEKEIRLAENYSEMNDCIQIYKDIIKALNRFTKSLESINATLGNEKNSEEDTLNK